MRFEAVLAGWVSFAFAVISGLTFLQEGRGWGEPWLIATLAYVVARIA